MSGRGSGIEVLVVGTGFGRDFLPDLLSPVRFHVEQTLAVLGSGRACASAVPMATSLDDVHRVLDAEARGRSAHLMMETADYARESRRPGVLTGCRTRRTAQA